MTRTRTRDLVVRLLLVVPLLAGGIALTPSPGAAALICDTGFEQQIGGTYAGSVVVPANGRCDLIDVVIRGSVQAEPGAVVYFQGSEVRGSVVATNPYTFVLIDTVVRGSVTATGSARSATLSRSEVRGNLVLTDNVGDWVYLLDTPVRGNVTISRNTVGSVEIFFNTIRGSLACEGNTPAPVGSNNAVSGAKSGQCQSV